MPSQSCDLLHLIRLQFPCLENGNSARSHRTGSLWGLNSVKKHMTCSTHSELIPALSSYSSATAKTKAQRSGDLRLPTLLSAVTDCLLWSWGLRKDTLPSAAINCSLWNESGIRIATKSRCPCNATAPISTCPPAPPTKLQRTHKTHINMQQPGTGQAGRLRVALHTPPARRKTSAGGGSNSSMHPPPLQGTQPQPRPQPRPHTLTE